MPESGLTSASCLRCLPDKTAGRNNLNEQESNAIPDDSGLDLDEPVPGGTIFVSGKKKLRIKKYPDTGGRGLSFPVNTLLLFHSLILFKYHC